VAVHEDVMFLRRAEVAEARDRKRHKTTAPYRIWSAESVPPGDFVALRTEAGSYLLGRGMTPVRDW
jgi:hypothetical protein